MLCLLRDSFVLLTRSKKILTLKCLPLTVFGRPTTPRYMTLIGNLRDHILGVEGPSMLTDVGFLITYSSTIPTF